MLAKGWIHAWLQGRTLGLGGDIASSISRVAEATPGREQRRARCYVAWLLWRPPKRSGTTSGTSKRPFLWRTVAHGGALRGPQAGSST